ncbi:DUF4832 domain-containing protein [Emticicia sp. BO119]|uniref:DUF4832 domain-containing protein n=1 Tax=Emticicia sp. BO119 TaxID=2757768 RepID=UPI0015F04A6F|nr:DUF4832 domain-containing protein [Emticicia sp. BO119]MBA4850389.1 DUF4832 domain-containing protein [Emticicia sp. BO119]
MKIRLLYLIVLFCCMAFVAKQNQTTSSIVNYSGFRPTQEKIFNPERGFYQHFDTNSKYYSRLKENVLDTLKRANISLIYRGFYLDEFINSPISQGYLDNVQADFDILRKIGLKAVIRFSYTKNSKASVRDASKRMIISHIQQLKPLFEKNVDVIYVVQAGFIGTYGEWHATTQEEFGIPTRIDSEPNYPARREVLDALLEALPASRMVQIRTPRYKTGMYGNTIITTAKAFNKSNESRIGFHNDCFLASDTDIGTYVKTKMSTEYSFLENQTRYLPMGGETCKVNSPRSDCPNALVELRKFHWSFLNLDYPMELMNQWKRGDNCYDDIFNNLGYRLQLNFISYPKKVSKSKAFKVELGIENKGFAAMFNERKAYLVFVNTITSKEVIVKLKTDPRKWLGKFGKIVEQIKLPKGINSGKYHLYLYLPDISPSIKDRVDYAVRFANEGIWDSKRGYNDLEVELNVMN